MAFTAAPNAASASDLKSNSAEALKAQIVTNDYNTHVKAGSQHSQKIDSVYSQERPPPSPEFAWVIIIANPPLVDNKVRDTTNKPPLLETHGTA